MMLAQPKPRPTAGKNSSAFWSISGMASMPSPAATRHTACTRPAPKRLETGISAKAATKATALKKAAISPLVNTAVRNASLCGSDV